MECNKKCYGEEIIKEHRYESKNSTNTYGNVDYRKKLMTRYT